MKVRLQLQLSNSLKTDVVGIGIGEVVAHPPLPHNRVRIRRFGGLG